MVITKIIFILSSALILSALNLNAQNEPQFSEENLNTLIEFCKETSADEIILVHEGEVLSNWKNKDCDMLTYNTASMVKSWTGLVVGILIDNGFIQSEDEPVSNFIPEWREGIKAEVTIKNLLTMTAGWDKRRGNQGILAIDTVNPYVIGLALDTLPNTRFQYSNESVQLLGVIIEKATQKSANRVFEEHLFEPLGMDSTRLMTLPSGEDIVFGGAQTTIQDALKVGLLILNGGRFNDTQIVSEEWVNKSVTPSKLSPYYGYLWWLDNASEHRNYAAMGDGGKLTIVFPDLNLVFLRRQSCNLEGYSGMPWMGPDFIKMIADVVNGND